MKFLKIVFFSLVFFSGIISCSSDSSNGIQIETQDLEAQILLDVSYGANTQQVYDIYLPAKRTSTTTKVILLIHGGGWIEGDKADMADFITLIQEEHPNHAIVNMNYILATINTPAFPNQFLDVGRVISKITSEADVLQILPQFGLIGTSAGAHIALQYDYVYDANDQVKMVADIVGPTNFKDPFYSENPNFEILLSLLVDEEAYPYITDYATAVSPAQQVSTSSSPTILFYGDQDPLVPLTDGQTLNTMLTNNKITHNFTVYEGGHGDDWSAASLLDLRSKLSEYITTHLEVQ